MPDGQDPHSRPHALSCIRDASRTPEMRGQQEVLGGIDAEKYYWRKCDRICQLPQMGRKNQARTKCQMSPRRGWDLAMQRPHLSAWSCRVKCVANTSRRKRRSHLSALGALEY